MQPDATDTITLAGDGAEDADVEALLDRLAAEDALGQLLRREGRMAALGTEADDVKLDWVDGVERALASPEQLDAVEAEARRIVAGGFRHVIWSGMGGSVQTVYTLKRLGYLDLPTLAIHPLDSTDPAALNRVLAAIGAPGGLDLATALRRTMMIGVSMGMTSEEPITHLEWFDGLLGAHGIAERAGHMEVMTLPDSYLDQFARPRGSRMVPIQLDAQNHTPGRMSAPATRVFLRPVALVMAALGIEGGVRRVLERGQALYELSHALSSDERAALVRRDAFVRLGAWLSRRTGQGRGAPKLLVQLPAGWEGFAPWLEQLVEESLGKEGRGFLIFYGQRPDVRYGDECAVLRIDVEGLPEPPAGPARLPALTLHVPSAAPPGDPANEPAGERHARYLGELAGLFLGFKKTVAAYAYLQDIVFAGQPAVEAYKKYARDLREAPGPIDLDAGATGDTRGAGRATFDGVTLDYSSLPKRGLLDLGALQRAVAHFGGVENPADVLAAVLLAARDAGSLRYLDVTWNGEPASGVRMVLERARATLANETLGIPAKLRTGPSDYHSTEQSEVDGPPELVSLRLVARRHEPVAAGVYDDTFLLAQARGTWQAMEDADRWIVFFTLPEAGDDAGGMKSTGALSRILEDTTTRVRSLLT